MDTSGVSCCASISADASRKVKGNEAFLCHDRQRVMQSFLLGEDQSGFTAERFFFLSRSDGGKGGTAEGMGFDLLQDHIVMCL